MSTHVTDRLLALDIVLASPFSGYKTKHDLLCAKCGFTWKNFIGNVTRKYSTSPCPGCRLAATRARHAKKLSRLGIVLVARKRYMCTKCKHTWNGSGNDVASVACNKCCMTKRVFSTGSREESRLNSIGIKFVSRYVRSTQKVDLQCTKGHTWSALVAHTFRCNACYSDQVAHRQLSPKRISILSEWNGKNSLRTLKCDVCSHVWTSKPWFARCPNCPQKFHRTEEHFARSVFEKLFDAPFPPARPKWLRGRNKKSLLELDGYNEQLQIAFEYQGPQHYMIIPPCVKTNDELAVLKRRDAKKRIMCYRRGVTLIVIPYYKRDIESFIVKTLRKRGVTVA